MISGGDWIAITGLIVGAVVLVTAIICYTVRRVCR